MKFGRKMMNLLWSPETKILKKCHSEAETMILRRSPSRWPISNQKVALICLKLNSDAKKQKKKTNTETKIFKKTAISEAETMELSRKTMNLSRSLICEPISNRKVAPICANGAKKKPSTEMKIIKKMPFRRPKRKNLDEKRWTSCGVLAIDPFPLEKLHKFAWIYIPAQKEKRAQKWKFSKKMPFPRP